MLDPLDAVVARCVVDHPHLGLYALQGVAERQQGLVKEQGYLIIDQYDAEFQGADRGLEEALEEAIAQT